MDKIELHQLCGYLPYKLKICYRVLDLENGNPNTYNPEDRLKNCIMEMTGARLDQSLLKETDRWYDKKSVFKPILRPMSDLTRQILFDAGFHGYIDYLTFEREAWVEKIGNEEFIGRMPYKYVQWLLKNHFDIHSLIPAGLAIDLNTLNTK